MYLYSVGLLLLLQLGTVTAQLWETGDNSTVKGCSNSCSVENDGDLPCWSSTLTFYQRTLISQLRHYVSVQIDIDQWHRRHGKPSGQNLDIVAADIKASFESELLSQDVLTKETVNKVADTLIARIKDISNHTLSTVPHFQCPLPCEYRHDMYRTLFIASIVLNGLLAITVIPVFVNSMRQEEDTEELVSKLY